MAAEFTRDSEWRMPVPGMEHEALARHGIDRDSSFLVGDEHTDIDCAMRARVCARCR
jgi:histidinol phosphatase-like enzyme